MASPVRFWAMLEALRDLLVADPDLDAMAPTVAIEEDPLVNVGGDHPLWIGLYGEGFRFPEGQPLAASTRLRVVVPLLVHVQAWSSESFAAAAERRDAALGLVLLATQRHPDLLGDGTVTQFIPTGGVLDTARRPDGPFLATADLRLEAETRLIT